VQTDPRIDAYIARAAPFARPILTHLRKLVHLASPEIEETIKWSHPAFVYRGKMLCGVAAFKNHATCGFWHQEMTKLLARELGRSTAAMGLLGRLERLADLPSDRTMLRYLKTAISLNEAGVPSRPKPKRRPPVRTPADLSAALKEYPKAAAAWQAFAPSHRRDYVEWITEARRAATRAQRLATTLDWLAAGKTRNWKYQDC
jgi:uncharacterized protein YdeI (YjbR/CyaY-like superfamily)